MKAWDRNAAKNTSHLGQVGPGCQIEQFQHAAVPLTYDELIGELRAQAERSECRPSLFHFRDRDGAEVDLVLEPGDGRVVGGEVKGGVTVRAEDVGGLRLLERRLGADFVAGLVLGTAPEPRHLGGRPWIMPMSALWQPCAHR